MRCPRILTCWSVRPRNSSVPSGQLRRQPAPVAARGAEADELPLDHGDAQRRTGGLQVVRRPQAREPAPDQAHVVLPRTRQRGPGRRHTGLAVPERHLAVDEALREAPRGHALGARPGTPDTRDTPDTSGTANAARTATARTADASRTATSRTATAHAAVVPGAVGALSVVGAPGIGAIDPAAAHTAATSRTAAAHSAGAPSALSAVGAVGAIDAAKDLLTARPPSTHAEAPPWTVPQPGRDEKYRPPKTSHKAPTCHGGHLTTRPYKEVAGPLPGSLKCCYRLWRSVKVSRHTYQA